MSEIKVTIVIPDTEYSKWDEFRIGGIEDIKRTLKSDIKQRLKQDGVDNFEITITND